MRAEERAWRKAYLMAFMMSSVIHYAQGDAEVMILIWFFAGIAIVLMRTLGSDPPAVA